MSSETPAKSSIDTDRWTSADFAREIARLADDKQAQDLVILDMRVGLQVVDWFVIATGRNRRHLGVVAEFIAKELKQYGLHRIGGSDLKDNNWVLLDFGSVVLHVFSEEGRSFYDLEGLWSDCERLPWTPPVRGPDAESDEDDEPEPQEFPPGLAPG